MSYVVRIRILRQRRFIFDFLRRCVFLLYFEGGRAQKAYDFENLLGPGEDAGATLNVASTYWKVLPTNRHSVVIRIALQEL